MFDAFPLFVFLGFVVLAVAMVRLDRRVSRGARGPGDRDVIKPKPFGLRQTPWELESIDQLARSGLGSHRRGELIALVNELTANADIHPPPALPPQATDEQLLAVVAQLEHHLGLD